MDLNADFVLTRIAHELGAERVQRIIAELQVAQLQAEIDALNARLAALQPPAAVADGANPT